MKSEENHTFADFLSRIEKDVNVRNKKQNKPLQFLSNIFFSADSVESREVGDSRRLLEEYFSGDRLESDTFKAVYRMMCIGLISDYTIDYNSKTTSIQISCEPKEYYLNALIKYYKRYLSEKLAIAQAKPVSEVVEKSSRNAVIGKCLKEVVSFAYEQVAKKRLLAIKDVEDACKESLKHKDGLISSQTFKDFTHTYFNSKYARKGNTTSDGRPASLLDDLSTQKSDSLKLAFKYMNIPLVDGSGPTITNLKHLRGASQRLIRSNSEVATLHLIKAFTLVVLTSTDKNTFNDARQELQEFLKIARTNKMIDSAAKAKKLGENMKKQILKYKTDIPELEKYLLLFDEIYINWISAWFHDFTNDYTSK